MICSITFVVVAVAAVVVMLAELSHAVPSMPFITTNALSNEAGILSCYIRSIKYPDCVCH